MDQVPESPLSVDDNIFSKKVSKHPSKNQTIDNMNNTFDLDGLGVDADYDIMQTNGQFDDTK